MAEPLPSSDERVASARRWVVAKLGGSTRRAADVEDITQEVMLRMARHTDLPEDEWRRLLNVVTVHELARFHARRLSSIPTEQLGDQEHTLMALADPEKQVIDREELRWAVAEGRAVSQHGIEALLRHEALGEPFKAQAEKEGRSAGALQRAASRARRHLQRRGRWAIVPGVLGGRLRRRVARYTARRLATVALAGSAAGAGVLTPWLSSSLAAADVQQASAAAVVAPTAVPPSASPRAPRLSASPKAWPAGASIVPSSASATKASGMHTVAGVHLGDGSTLSAGVSVQRDGDKRSALQQAVDCLDRGPSLDPHRFGCPA